MKTYNLIMLLNVYFGLNESWFILILQAIFVLFFQLFNDIQPVLINAAVDVFRKLPISQTYILVSIAELKRR